MVNEGDKLSLRCVISGSAPLNIQWMKDRRELKSSGNTKISFVGGTASLEVSQVSKADAGDYLCKASNAAGSDFCKAKVTVAGNWSEGWSSVALVHLLHSCCLRAALEVSGSGFSKTPQACFSCY